jgi:ABC-2 type transport system ATP-binding protein
MGTMAQMRHLSALTVEATFEGDVPDVAQVPGVSMVEVQGPTLRCQVRGSVESLLKVLAHSGVQELLSREPSLEELFLSHYGAPSVEATHGPDEK